jgi:UDPglucose 6-dehydrogenase
MKICVQGLWHLGSVTAACLASVGHDVLGLDDDLKNIDNLNQGKAPLFEPGLNEMIQREVKEKHLRFTQNSLDAVAEAKVLWVTFDMI